MLDEQIDKMQKLCYNLSHQIKTLSKDDVSYIQYHLHAYVEYMKNYVPKPHRDKE